MTEFDEIIKGLSCPYCKCETVLVSDKEIYGKNSNYGGMYYRCLQNFNRYVGTCSDNKTSLGRIANKELRKRKMAGHKAFDPLWKIEPTFFKSQAKAYEWLSIQMNLDLDKTHFGMFTIELCNEAIILCNNLNACWAIEVF